jgi:hypothetical protein
LEVKIALNFSSGVGLEENVRILFGMLKGRSSIADQNKARNQGQQ